MCPDHELGKHEAHEKHANRCTITETYSRRLRLRLRYEPDRSVTLPDAWHTFDSGQDLLLKAHAVHEEKPISKNQRDGALTLSHVEDQWTTTLKLSRRH